MKFRTLVLVLIGFILMSCATFFSSPTGVIPIEAPKQKNIVLEEKKPFLLIENKETFLFKSKEDVLKIIGVDSCSTKDIGLEQVLKCSVQYTSDVPVTMQIFFTKENISFMAYVETSETISSEVSLGVYSFEFDKYFKSRGEPIKLLWSPPNLPPTIAENRQRVHTDMYVEISVWQLDPKIDEFIILVVKSDGTTTATTMLFCIKYHLDTFLQGLKYIPLPSGGESESIPLIGPITDEDTSKSI